MSEDSPIVEISERAIELGLKEFFQNNPDSVLLPKDDGEAREIIAQPWGDPSLKVVLPEADEALAPLVQALNQVLLPKRFSAIWHCETKSLEVIWTAYKLADSYNDLKSREFDISLEGTNIHCRFGRSTDILLEIAKHTFPASNPGVTQFRNLQSYHRYTKRPEQSETSIGEPISFFIEGLEWDEEDLVKKVNVVNFYMTYYDTSSPIVLVHDDDSDVREAAARDRYLIDTFPEKITGRYIDEHILTYWMSAFTGNEITRFNLYYRIIEYAALHFANEDTATKLKLILARPDIGTQESKALFDILSVFASDMSGKSDEIPRRKKLLEKCVDPRILWRDIDANKHCFTNEACFDGGYCLPPLIAEKATFDTFKIGGVDTVADHFRKLRNVLSHGRDQYSDGLISPTRRNYKLLRPWVNLIQSAVGEVVIYKDAL
ncbi:hypothetical protein [uncultured Hyphomonas sp.]|uniref:hypothetical protein n=1 Tax=uncultured Hyphomonas sp. TaxID=225298 RepID=UPI002AAB457D|nr:hypothetical protein [uncultured Hyphomonas sp.]